MQLFQSRFCAAVMALGLFAAISTMPVSAAPITYNLELTGDITGHATLTFDTDGAVTDPQYEFRAGDLISVTLQFGSGDIVVTQDHAHYPAAIPFSGGVPSDVFFSASIDSLPGFVDYINLTMGLGAWQAQYHTVAGDEGTVNGTFVFVDDGTEIPVPAPASALLFAAGLAALGWSRRRA